MWRCFLNSCNDSATPNFSPRMWRCFSITLPKGHTWKLFSTYVEVFLQAFQVRKALFAFLHVCGGVSEHGLLDVLNTRFSPRMWRCFRMCICILKNDYLFSTYVEVFLLMAVFSKVQRAFLHVCGGVSLVVLAVVPLPSFSPRMWRCFQVVVLMLRPSLLFSTYVEVFPGISR